MPVFLARVRRYVVDGELAGVSLDLIQDSTTVQLEDGDEFFTVEMKVDPFEA